MHGIYRGLNPTFQIDDPAQTRDIMIARLALLMHTPFAEVERWPYVHIRKLLAVHNADQRVQNYQLSKK